MTIFGIIGTILLLLSYVLLVTKFSKWFLPVDTIATAMLVVHASSIGDVIFIIVNAFIALMLIIKMAQGGLK